LNEEIKKVVSKIISDKNGYNTKIDDNASLIRYGLDSLDMIVIVDEIEDNFNVEISTISLTKPMRVSEMSKLLETGFIGRKFEK
jgi:acyl carrier protein